MPVYTQASMYGLKYPQVSFVCYLGQFAPILLLQHFYRASTSMQM